MATGLGLLGLAPAVFWAMTPKELEAAVRGRLGLTVPSAPLAPTDLAALIERFPDQ
jgi:uncharacterized phage protein (TIGR02216 family)